MYLWIPSLKGHIQILVMFFYIFRWEIILLFINPEIYKGLGMSYIRWKHILYFGTVWKLFHTNLLKRWGKYIQPQEKKEGRRKLNLFRDVILKSVVPGPASASSENLLEI